MPQRKDRVVTVVLKAVIITKGEKHCHSDCGFLTHENHDSIYCELFHEPLEWDDRIKTHGCIRAYGCCNAERVTAIKPIRS